MRADVLRDGGCVLQREVREGMLTGKEDDVMGCQRHPCRWSAARIFLLAFGRGETMLEKAICTSRTCEILTLFRPFWAHSAANSQIIPNCVREMSMGPARERRGRAFAPHLLRPVMPSMQRSHPHIPCRQRLCNRHGLGLQTHPST